MPEGAERARTYSFVERLLEPGRYPHPAQPVELLETHISWVLLAGDYAYKIKKPVSLGFVDFSSAQARRHYCEEELRLSRRTAPGQLLDAQQTYIYALDTVDRLRPGKRQALSQLESPAQVTVDQLTLQRQIDNLRSLGMTDAQIEEIGRTRRLTHDVRIISPAKGLIIARNVSPGQRFLKGENLYQIADLSRVWVLADVFENEAGYYKPGVKVTVHQPHRKLALPAIVSEVPPTFDATTRTLKVRLEMDNPDLIFRRDMFVDVELSVHLPPAVAVPAEAVIFSGRRKTVFVETGNGVFEPRQVGTGWRLGDRVRS